MELKTKRLLLRSFLPGDEETCFVYPGAIQYFGPTEVCDATTVTLALEKGE